MLMIFIRIIGRGAQNGVYGVGIAIDKGEDKTLKGQRTIDR